MYKCSNCKIVINDERKTCPLCHKVLDDMSEDEVKAAAERFGMPVGYPDVRERDKKIRFVLRLILFVFIVMEAAAVIVNYIVTPHYKWSLISAVALLYFYICIYYWVKRDAGFALKLGIQLVLTGLVVYFIDRFTGNRGWAVEWVIPGLILLGDAIVFFFFLLNRQMWYSYLVILIFLTVCSIGVMSLYMTKHIDNFILPIICISLSCVALLATIVFGDKEFSREMARRFHV